jgi:E3 ubiquitin-protein ligase MYCBP2
VCGDPDCVAKLAAVCTKTLACHHACCGVRGEQETAGLCLPCLAPACAQTAREAEVKAAAAGGGARLQAAADGKSFLPLCCQEVDGADFCPVCMESYSSGPCLQLGCGHLLHYHCVAQVLQKRWTGAAISFAFLQCPMCNSPSAFLDQPLLAVECAPLLKLRSRCRSKALQRLKYEGLDKDPKVLPGGRFHSDPAGFAMTKFAYYQCAKCDEPYYGGGQVCAAGGGAFDRNDLICPGCQPNAAEQDCPKHGSDFIEYKCRFCCSIAVFFCFGTTHFCNTCHDQPGLMQRKQDGKELPKCPAGPLGVALPEGTQCPLKCRHPPTGEEHALGCGVCRNARDF